MAVYKLSDILKDVRIALDYNVQSDTLEDFGDIDTLTLNDIIRSKVLESVAYVHGISPTYLLDGGHHFGDAIYWGSLNSGWCLLPEDFMRLVIFKMSDWERSVYHAISEKDEEYEKQSSRFKGLRGTPQKPICAIVFRSEGRVLEFYSCKNSDALVEHAVYLPYPQIDRFGGVEICERCYRAVVYHICSLVLLTIGEIERSQALLDLSKRELGG